MGFLKAIAVFLGRLLAEILPTLISEWKKPKKTKMVGGDQELNDDIDADIERENLA